jgi:hypothetical protein
VTAPSARPSRRPTPDGAALLTIRRGGRYLRVADSDWDDPLSGEYARSRGGRWNPPGEFPVVYLNRDEQVARANVLHRFAGLPYGPEDLDPETAPVLVGADVPRDQYADVVTDEGCAAAGLPTSYPRDESGGTVPHESCRPVGQAVWDAGLPGIACRSAAPAAPAEGEELAWFERGSSLIPAEVRPFGDWF